MRTKNILRSPKYIIIFSIMMICGFYIAYPYTTLWSISKNIQTHNLIELNKNLNWRAIKNNLSSNIIDQMHFSAPQSDDELPEFANSFASKTITNAVRSNIDLNHLQLLVNYLVPYQADNQNYLNVQNAFQIFMNSHIYFTSPITLHARITPEDMQQTPIKITMKLQKWRWKITSISLPDPLLSTLLESRKP